MQPELVFAAVLVAIVLWLNIKASLLVLKDNLSEPVQRRMQLLLVWLLPVVGAIIVFAVHRPAEKPSGKYREPRDSSDDFGFPRYGSRGRSNDGADDD